MFIVGGPRGAKEEPPAPKAVCEVVESVGATVMGSTPELGPKDELEPSTGLPLSWFSVLG